MAPSTLPPSPIKRDLINATKKRCELGIVPRDIRIALITEAAKDTLFAEYLLNIVESYIRQWYYKVQAETNKWHQMTARAATARHREIGLRRLAGEIRSTQLIKPAQKAVAA